MSIAEEVSKVKRSISELQGLLTHLQKECKHEGLVGEFHGDTGNWDRTDDRYWVNFNCPVCGKYWSEEQNELVYSGNVPVGYHYSVSKEGFAFIKKSKYD